MFPRQPSLPQGRRPGSQLSEAFEHQLSVELPCLLVLGSQGCLEWGHRGPSDVGDHLDNNHLRLPELELQQVDKGESRGPGTLNTPGPSNVGGKQHLISDSGIFLFQVPHL